MRSRRAVFAAAVVFTSGATMLARDGQVKGGYRIGDEVAVARHLADDEEFSVSVRALVAHGKKLFEAVWTDQEGGGRPLMKGTGRSLTDPARPLTGARAFNRISAPDANSCQGCHNAPYGISGGGGDFVTNVFVLAQRFDFVTFDPSDRAATRGARDERQVPVSADTVGNLRSSTGMFGSGYIEMLARQITADLQRTRDSMDRGETKLLVSKGISFGSLTRKADGMWDTSAVEGLSRLSLLAPTPIDKPSLIIRPWHQAGNVISLREFTNNAYNHHHGIQATERFGVGTDPDGDGHANEMTRADVTAATVFQAALAVPGRVIPNDPEIEKAVFEGERQFEKIGCATCHVPSLPLYKSGWKYSEPNPYNPPGSLRRGDARVLEIDLADPALPAPRLTPAHPSADSIEVALFTDFKLHDISDPGDPESAEPLDMNHPVWSPRFAAGNRRFLTKRLWGAANELPYFHHGLYTTLRHAILAHSGEALQQRRAFQQLTDYQQRTIIEFLKTLQVLPPGTTQLVVDEEFRPKSWPQWTGNALQAQGDAVAHRTPR